MNLHLLIITTDSSYCLLVAEHDTPRLHYLRIFFTIISGRALGKIGHKPRYNFMHNIILARRLRVARL